MNEFPNLSDPSHIIKDLIVHIQACNAEIERLNIDKQRSEQKLKEMLGHTKHGSHTHEFLDYKITITTGSNLTLDKNKFYDYLTGDDKIDARYEVVKPVTTYELNKKAITNLEMFGSQHDIALKNKFVKQTEKKLHVRIQKIEPDIVGDYVVGVPILDTDDIDQ